MNDPSQMLNQAPLTTMSQPQLINQPQIIAQSQILNQPQLMSQPQLLNNPHMMAQSQAINPQPHASQPQLLNQSRMMMTQSQPIMNRGYKMWSRPQPAVDGTNIKYQSSLNPSFVNQIQPNLGRSNWKGRNVTDKRKDLRRMEKHVPSSAVIGPSNAGGYMPPTLHELQSQNRLKARKFYPKRKYNNRFAPYAPRNTTSFLIRAKKAGGIASLVSPSPVTPAVLPTPMFSPSREVLVDMAKEEWGVDGYGSMKGLIRLRSPGNEAEVHDEEEEEEGGGSSESDVEEHVEMERRLDHDLSRFEMIYPSYGAEHNNVLENRVDDQDSHIAQLEEENLTLKERLFLMERELSDLRRRMQFLERHNHGVEYANEEVVENESEYESEIGGENDMEIGENASANVDGGNAGVDSKRNYVELVNNGSLGDACVEMCTSNRRNIDDEKHNDEKAVEQCVISSGADVEKNVGEEEKMTEQLEEGFELREKVKDGEIADTFVSEGITKKDIKDDEEQNESECVELISKENKSINEETRHNFVLHENVDMNEQFKEEMVENASSEKSIG